MIRLRANKEALLALRESTNFTSWKEKAKAGWLDLETFTESGQLGACRGVTVDDGHVVKLDLRDSGLTGLCVSIHNMFPVMPLFNEFLLVKVKHQKSWDNSFHSAHWLFLGTN